MGDVWNTVMDIEEYFTKDNREMSPDEFARFWYYLTEEERRYYRTTPLS